MKVYELIEELKKLPQELEVVVAGDDEGNSFRKVPDGWVGVEKFDEDLDIYAPEDYEDEDFDTELTDYVCIG